MGFLDNIISGLGGAVTGFLTGGPAGAIAGGIAGVVAGDTDTPKQITAAPTVSPTSLSTRALTPVTTLAPAGGSTLGKLLQSVALGGLPQAVVGLTGVLDPPAVAAAGCPAGKNRVLTVVQTFDPAGRVVKQTVLDGRPFLMNKDLVIAKRVFRTIQKASTRLPRKTVKESATKQLTSAVTEKALSNVLTGHHNGHHPNG